MKRAEHSCSFTIRSSFPVNSAVSRCVFESSVCALWLFIRSMSTCEKALLYMLLWLHLLVLPARPQPTSRPRVPQKDVQARQVLLSWEPGSDGLSPVRYYTVQLRELPVNNWTVHSASVNHEATSYIVSRYSLLRRYQLGVEVRGQTSLTLLHQCFPC